MTFPRNTWVNSFFFFQIRFVQPTELQLQLSESMGQSHPSRHTNYLQSSQGKINIYAGSVRTDQGYYTWELHTMSLSRKLDNQICLCFITIDWICTYNYCNCFKCALVFKMLLSSKLLCLRKRKHNELSCLLILTLWYSCLPNCCENWQYLEKKALLDSCFPEIPVTRS